MNELKGRNGIITGASSGIGFTVANILAENGASVIAVSRTGSPKDSHAESHSGIKHIKGDIADYKLMKQIVEENGKERGFDFLINNAGVTVKKRAEEISMEEYEFVHRVNVFSVFNLCSLCYPYLKKSAYTGRIINITSMAAHLGFSQVVPYCSSKAAVLGLTRGLAIEWANDNIVVNSIAPGWFPSELLKSVMDEDRKAKILARMPVHKFGNPSDIGKMVLFLLSQDACYITGQDFAIDGGALAFGF
jgi:NAD(P)-dependent dehydrogenase (short-subunit alcohol dehydrogenase family)